MPGPGGRGRSGGFGGSSRGGSFGGGMSRGGGSFNSSSRSRYGYGGVRHTSYNNPSTNPYNNNNNNNQSGCCLSNMMAMILVPFVIIILLIAMFSGNVNVSNVTEEVYTPQNGVIYDEVVFQDYAFKCYNEEFTDDATHEDNLLIVFLTNDSKDDFYTIAFIGDNLRDEVASIFGNEETEFGHAMLSNIDGYYAYSIDASLASVMRAMQDAVVGLGLESSFISETDKSNAIASHVTNHTTLDISEETLNSALSSFTSATGIPAVIVIDDMTAVFEEVAIPEETPITEEPSSSKLKSNIKLIAIIAIVIIGGVAIGVIVGKKSKKGGSLSSDEPQPEDEHKSYDPEIK